MPPTTVTGAPASIAPTQFNANVAASSAAARHRVEILLPDCQFDIAYISKAFGAEQGVADI